ncbi:MAG: hypothetical protein EOO10_17910 [Chitinophagaceae bacterium]|nr:MAG: hypothetical protein EOO10_17910 [Chitinophagaceae bacterium]
MIGVLLTVLMAICSSSGQSIGKNELSIYGALPRFKELTQYYQLNGGRFTWIGNLNLQTELIALLKKHQLSG